MVVEQVGLNDLGVEHSPYRFPPWLCRGREEVEQIGASMKREGQILPVTAVAGPGGPWLMDGFARFEAARALGFKTLNVLILEPVSPPVSIFTLVFLAKRERIVSSPAAMARFVTLGLHAGVTRSEAAETLLPLMGLSGRERMLERLETAASLPDEFMEFAHAKRFSLGRILASARFPLPLIQEVLALGGEINLSASLFEFVAGHIHDICRWEGVEPADIVREARLECLTGATVQIATARLKEWLSKRRNPTLGAVSSRLESLKKGLGLPEGVSCRWDPSLETHRIELVLSLEEEGDLARILTGLARAQEGIGRMLGEL